jgi:ABC-2 type transport system permease protein
MVKEEAKHTTNRKTFKQQSWFRLLIILAIILLINVVSSFRYFRLDLTQDKRYTLGDPTIDLLNSLDDEVYVKVYLEGDLPAGFRKLKEATKDLLDEMRNSSKTNISYDFIDPLSTGNQQEKNEVYQQLIDLGLEPVNLEVQSEDKKTEKIIFPGAIIYYKKGNWQ